jgi:hypothetical protein
LRHDSHTRDPQRGLLKFKIGVRRLGGRDNRY